MIKGRQQYGQKSRPAMTQADIDHMKAEASCYMVVQFHNNPRPFSIWSKESQNKKILNISDAINEMFRIFDRPQWRGCVASAAIFDMRYTKRCSSENKIYQYEHNSWKMVNPVSW